VRAIPERSQSPPTLGKDQALIDHIDSSSAVGGLGEPDDIAEVVALLAGPGRWINGRVIHADSGPN
jgi:3-oxoacyl-[acyl-carrier protein] reductase